MELTVMITFLGERIPLEYTKHTIPEIIQCDYSSETLCEIIVRMFSIVTTVLAITTTYFDAYDSIIDLTVSSISNIPRMNMNNWYEK